MGVWAKKLGLPEPARTKCCTKCREAKPLNQFWKRHSSIDGYSYWCKECFRKNTLRLYQSIRDNDTPALVTTERLREMMVEQDGRCAICQTDITGSGPRYGSRGKRKACVDHCHTTGKVRGLLCNRCNTAVGYIEKSPVPVTKYFDYINKHREVNHEIATEDFE